MQKMQKIKSLKFVLTKIIIISLVTQTSFANEIKGIKLNPQANQKKINNSSKKTTWDFIKGKTPQNSLFLGMLTFHFNPNSLKHDRWSNDLPGGVYKGVFAGTLINSFNDRAYVFGIQRDVYTKKFSNNWQINSGYRLGLITGYDSRMSKVADKTKVLPLPEVYSDFMYKKVGIELSWSMVVVSAKFIVRF